MTLQEILEYYANRLIIQYRVKSKARDTIKCLVDQSVCDGIMAQLKTCFDLDTAVGNQLDILGRIVGVPRNVIGLDLEHTFFSFVRYDEGPVFPDRPGFGHYADDPYPTGLFRRYANTGTYTLTDYELRVLIKLKIVFNTAGSSFKGLKEALFRYFNGDIDIVTNSPIEDNFNFTSYNGVPDSNGFGRYSDSPYPSNHWLRYADYTIMSLTYNVLQVYHNAFEAAIYLNIVPKPAAVGYDVNYI